MTFFKFSEIFVLCYCMPTEEDMPHSGDKPRTMCGNSQVWLTFMYRILVNMKAKPAPNLYHKWEKNMSVHYCKF